MDPPTGVGTIRSPPCGGRSRPAAGTRLRVVPDDPGNARERLLAYMGIPDQSGLMSRRARLDLTLRAVRGCTAVTALSEAAAVAFWRWLGVEAFRDEWPRAEHPTIFCGPRSPSLGSA